MMVISYVSSVLQSNNCLLYRHNFSKCKVKSKCQTDGTSENYGAIKYNNHDIQSDELYIKRNMYRKHSPASLF